MSARILRTLAIVAVAIYALSTMYAFTAYTAAGISIITDSLEATNAQNHK